MPSVLIDGIRSSTLSLGMKTLSRYGCRRPSKVVDAAATPGVLENMSMHSPSMKLHSRTAHLGKPRLKSKMKYTYSKGVAQPKRLIWLSTNACTTQSIMNVKKCLITDKLILYCLSFSTVSPDISFVSASTNLRPLASVRCVLSSRCCLSRTHPSSCRSLLSA